MKRKSDGRTASTRTATATARSRSGSTATAGRTSTPATFECWSLLPHRLPVRRRSRLRGRRGIDRISLWRVLRCAVRRAGCAPTAIGGYNNERQVTIYAWTVRPEDRRLAAEHGASGDPAPLTKQSTRVALSSPVRWVRARLWTFVPDEDGVYYSTRVVGGSMRRTGHRGSEGPCDHQGRPIAGVVDEGWALGGAVEYELATAPLVGVEFVVSNDDRQRPLPTRASATTVARSSVRLTAAGRSFNHPDRACTFLATTSGWRRLATGLLSDSACMGLRPLEPPPERGWAEYHCGPPFHTLRYDRLLPPPTLRASARSKPAPTKAMQRAFYTNGGYWLSEGSRGEHWLELGPPQGGSITSSSL